MGEIEKFSIANSWWSGRLSWLESCCSRAGNGDTKRWARKGSRPRKIRCSCKELKMVAFDGFFCYNGNCCVFSNLVICGSIDSSANLYLGNSTRLLLRFFFYISYLCAFNLRWEHAKVGTSFLLVNEVSVFEIGGSRTLSRDRSGVWWANKSGVQVWNEEGKKDGREVAEESKANGRVNTRGLCWLEANGDLPSVAHAL